jgi:hypothetical protein
MRDLMGTGHIWFRMSTATRPKMPDLAQFAHRFARRPADAFHTYEKAGRIAKWFWSVAEDCQVLLDPDCDPGAAERPPAVLYLPDGYEVSPDAGPVRPHHDPWDAVALLMSALTRPG